jgi:carbamoyl-phosphate synthase large subunit
MVRVELAPAVPRLEEPLHILFTSAGRRVSLIHAFRRAADAIGVELHVHVADAQATAPAMHVADHVTVVPAVRHPEYIDQLVEYCQSNGIDALIPLIDPELPVLADARDRFGAVGTRCMVSSPDVMKVSVDKVHTCAFLTRHGFRTPRIFSSEELDSASLPLFTKPRVGSSSLGAYKIRTPEDLAYFRTANPDSIIQEYIHGVEYTVDVFADFDGRPRCAVPRRRHEVRGGEVSKGQTVKHREMMRDHCRLVELLGGCVGIITIQCFLTPHDEIVFIEINPRFGGGVPLSIEAGADSPRWLLELLLGRDPDISWDGWTDGMYMLRYDQGIFVQAEAVERIRAGRT